MFANIQRMGISHKHNVEEWRIKTEQKINKYQKKYNTTRVISKLNVKAIYRI